MEGVAPLATSSESSTPQARLLLSCPRDVLRRLAHLSDTWAALLSFEGDQHASCSIQDSSPHAPQPYSVVRRGPVSVVQGDPDPQAVVSSAGLNALLDPEGEYHVVSVVGDSVAPSLFKFGAALSKLEHYEARLFHLSPDDLSVSLVVPSIISLSVMDELHGSLFGRRPNDGLLGDPIAGKEGPPRRWWMHRRQELMDLVAENGSCYVYDAATIVQRARQLLGLEAVSRIFYAIKANNCRAVLRGLEKRGLGFECVSPGEIRHVLSIFPDLDRQRILFTPNFAPRADFEFAFSEQSVWVTVDSMYMLEAWPDLFKGQQVLVRVDTGVGRGHHEHVKTAGKYAKFGVAMDELPQFAQLASKVGVKVVGMHCHAGSGIMQEESWSITGETLLEQGRALFPDLKFINVGGGLGVATKPSERPLDMSSVDAALQKIKPEGVELWMEPGRFLVAESGVLLARATQIKNKRGVRWIGVEAGFNTLLRPILYNAYHGIYNLTRIQEPAIGDAQVVGYICETGDVFGHARPMPETKEGDVVLIDVVGAYGATMSSSYNLREPAQEILLKPAAKATDTPSRIPSPWTGGAMKRTIKIARDTNTPSRLPQPSPVNLVFKKLDFAPEENEPEPEEESPPPSPTQEVIDDRRNAPLPDPEPEPEPEPESAVDPAIDARRLALEEKKKALAARRAALQNK